MTAAPPASVYLDYNATAPMLPVVWERMAAAARHIPGNASSPHGFGQEARALLEERRVQLAGALGFGAREIVFNSGGSEANNTVLRGLAELPRPVHLVTSPIEHPSVLRCAEWLERQGVAVSYLPVDGEGRVVPEAVGELVKPETRVLSVMAANNETGVVQPLEALGRIVSGLDRETPILLHTDAVQAFGRIPLHVADWGFAAATVTAHKLGGPKGIGALACRGSHELLPLVLGGGQERGKRAGTESILLVEGFLAAVEWVWGHTDELVARLTGFRNRLAELAAGIDGFFLNGAGAERLPNTLNLGFEGVSAESLVTALDLEGIAVSSGSACSSGAIEPSHVLQAMSLPPERVAASVRISMGHGTTAEDVERCAEALRKQVARIRGLGSTGKRLA